MAHSRGQAVPREEQRLYIRDGFGGSAAGGIELAGRYVRGLVVGEGEEAGAAVLAGGRDLVRQVGAGQRGDGEGPHARDGGEVVAAAADGDDGLAEVPHVLHGFEPSLRGEADMSERIQLVRVCT